MLWHKATVSGHVRAIITCAQAMSQRLGLASDRRPYGKLNEPPRRIFVIIRAPPPHPPGAVVPYYGQGTGRLQTATG